MQIKVITAGKTSRLAALWRLSRGDSPVGSRALGIGKAEDEEASLTGGRVEAFRRLC